MSRRLAIWALFGILLLAFPLALQAQQPDTLATDPPDTLTADPDTAEVGAVDITRDTARTSGPGAIDTLATDTVQALQDTSLSTADSSTADSAEFLPEPTIALRRGLMLPGWGQIYNRSYWKLPIVYGGMGTLVFLAWQQHRLYRGFDDDYQATVTDDNIRGDENLRSQRDLARRNRDLFLIFTTLSWGLQAVEAYVDAHLQGFEITDDLSLRVRPGFQTNLAGHGTPTLNFSLEF